MSDSLWFHVHGILQGRILEWVAISFSRGSSQHRDWTWVSCIAGRFFTVLTTGKPWKKKKKIIKLKKKKRPTCQCNVCIMTTIRVKVLVAQSCPTLCDPTDCSPPGSSVHGILQARILERVTIPLHWLNPSLSHCRQILYFWASREATVTFYVEVHIARTGASCQKPMRSPSLVPVPCEWTSGSRSLSVSSLDLHFWCTSLLLCNRDAKLKPLS